MDGKKRITNITGNDLKSTHLIQPIQGATGSMFDVLARVGVIEVADQSKSIASIIMDHENRVKSLDHVLCNVRKQQKRKAFMTKQLDCFFYSVLSTAVDCEARACFIIAHVDNYRVFSFLPT